MVYVGRQECNAVSTGLGIIRHPAGLGCSHEVPREAMVSTS